jgi:general stress protein YciG
MKRQPETGNTVMATNKENDTKHNADHSKHEDKSAAGQKGVSQEQVGSGKENDPNNFANNKERASAAGKKGGHNS